MECTFHNVLKSLREKHNVTQEELAKYLNVSRSTIAGYEARNRQPDYEKLLGISQFFNVSVDYLISGIEDSHILNSTNQISSEIMESTLLMIFRNLSYDSKHRILDYAKILEIYEDSQKSSNRRITTKMPRT